MKFTYNDRQKSWNGYSDFVKASFLRTRGRAGVAGVNLEAAAIRLGERGRYGSLEAL